MMQLLQVLRAMYAANVEDEKLLAFQSSLDVIHRLSVRVNQSKPVNSVGNR
jgi:hypothetical protein